MLQDLSISWLGGVLGPSPSSAGDVCRAPSGSSSVLPRSVWWAPGAKSWVRQSKLGKSKCSLANGQEEGAFGSSGETAGFCEEVVGVCKVAL